MGFGKDFLWGAASAAFQIEGAWDEDGKRPSVWDTASHTRGRIAHGEVGDTACDHYHRMREDVALLKELGLKSYRFSVSWPRVILDETGAVNEKGMRFYSDLVDELLRNGIEPMVTLYHWDHPQYLQDRGGWRNPGMVRWFADYAAAVVKRLSDRVRYWITINEPQLFIGMGYHTGTRAPFESSSDEEIIKVSYNVLKAHGAAVRAIRDNAVKAPIIGMAPTGDVTLPESDRQEDIEAARAKSFAVKPGAFTLGNAWWADPVFLGEFPEAAWQRWPGAMKAVVRQEDLALISQPLDFYGFNVYQATTTRGLPDSVYDEYAYQGSPKTALGWNVTPEVMYWAPKFFYERYGKPILITENGMAGLDWPALDGKVHDPQRVDFLHRYLRELRRAAEEVPVLGYTCWSAMDNMEWNRGYDPRFGLIYVNYQTQERIVKDSGYWYRRVIETNGDEL